MASDWASLPAVLLETSLLMLSGPDAARAGCVCRYWRDALSIGDGSLWRSLCARFGEAGTRLGREGSWRQRFLRLYALRARAAGAAAARSRGGALAARTAPDPGVLADHLQALEPAREGKYAVLQVPRRGRVEIRPFVREQGFAFRTGCAYYEITKAETISRTKRIVLWERAGAGTFLEGDAARRALGLHVRSAEWNIAPSEFPREVRGMYRVFVQSRSIGRRLVNGTALLVDTESTADAVGGAGAAAAPRRTSCAADSTAVSATRGSKSAPWGAAGASRSGRAVPQRTRRGAAAKVAKRARGAEAPSARRSKRQRGKSP